MSSGTILSSYGVGYDRQTHVTKFGRSINMEWEEIPQVGMPEAPMDGGTYLARGQSWVKIDEGNSRVDILWHRPKIEANQEIRFLTVGLEMEPYTIKGSYLRSEGGEIEMPSPSDITSVVWEASNLPAGLTIGESTGIISGTPTTPGSYTVNLTVTTNWGTDTESMTIIVGVPDSWQPVITPGQTLNLTAGEAMTPYQVTGTNVTVTSDSGTGGGSGTGD